MKKINLSKAGIFNPRFVIAILFCLAGLSLAVFTVASTPDHGTLTDANTVLTYDAGPLLAPNQSPVGLGQLDVGPRCDGAAFQCDSYQLNTNITTPGTAIKVTLSWTDTGSKQSDYDLYVFKGNVATLDGSRPADFQSASGADPEIASIFPVATGPQTYTIKIVPYTPTAETLHVRIELLTGVGGAGFPGFGSADPVAPGVPRYMNFYAPVGSGAEAFSGEINIGYNPSTHHIMLMNSGPVWRLTPPEWLLQAKPECCEGMWEDVTNLSTITGLDPILWTDSWTDPALPIPGATPTSGARTFAANSTTGTNGVYAYSDTDGGLGLGGPPDWFPISASPPNASSDHETIGSGPYWPGPANPLGGNLPNPNSNAANHGHAIYYCAQTFPVGAAACQRSDTYGTSYGPSVVMYNPNGPGEGYPSPAPSPLPVIPTNTQCSGIHGHVHVGPDGTVYVPVRDCGSNAGLVYSTDGGVTWNERIVPNSAVQQHGSDPSIAIGADNTLYYFYIASENQGNEGHMYVQITNNITSLTPTWSTPFDLGASHGVKNAVFPEAVTAGFGPNVVPADGARAAVGFLGTDQAGYYEGITFPGVWYLFIATTYDHGAHWTVVNATPNDPVQGMIGIWQGGGSNANRNLLDFNEVTFDERGRVLFAYDDGCVGDCISDPTKASFGARMRVARQIGGKSLISAFDNTTDTTTPIPAKAPCLSGTRDDAASTLEWVAPDGGGAAIVGYQIFRGTSAGSESLIATTGSVTAPNASTKFIDNAAANTGYDQSAHDYYYTVKAITSLGVGAASNEIHLIAGIPVPLVAENPCVVPGVTMLTDAAGDTSVLLGLIGTPATPGTDLKALHIAQTGNVGGDPLLTFTIDTDANATGTEPTGTYIYAAMRIVGPDPAVAGDTSTEHYRGVRVFFNDPSSPSLESYVPGAANNGTVDGRFVQSSKPAEAGSSYDGPNGKITIIVKASDLTLAPGSVISGFVSASGTNSDPENVGIPSVSPLFDQMPNSLSYANSYVVADLNACGSLQTAVSRKRHNSDSLIFDVPLLPQVGGKVGVEDRTGGQFGNHTLVLTFDRPVKTAGGGVVAVAPATTRGTIHAGPDVNQLTVDLENVQNAQHLMVNLGGVTDASSNALLGNLSIPMDVLLGDVNGDGKVLNGDVGLVKSQVNSPVSATNFRNDVNADGNILNGDVGITKGQVSTALP